MIFLASVVVIPVLIAIGFYVFQGREITTREFLCHVLINFVVAAGCSYATYHSAISDVEILNGRVRNKASVRVSCSHSYPCRCRTVSSGFGKNRTTRTKCDTCYEHSYDVNWEVYSTVGTIRIDRVNRQGTEMPPRWDAVFIGEPVSLPHSYDNYIKGASDSLFVDHGNVDLNLVPTYPGDIYDYYRVKRVVESGGASLENNRRQQWENLLNELNADLGHKKHCNIIVVLARNTTPDFSKSLSYKWLGGKKNDIIVVLGVEPGEKYPHISWVDVVAWSKNSKLRIQLRDALIELHEANPKAVLDTVRENVVNYYQRKPMSDFEYLRSSIKPTRGMWLGSLVLSIFISLVTGSVLATNNERDRSR